MKPPNSGSRSQTSSRLCRVSPMAFHCGLREDSRVQKHSVGGEKQPHLCSAPQSPGSSSCQFPGRAGCGWAQRGQGVLGGGTEGPKRLEGSEDESSSHPGAEIRSLTPSPAQASPQPPGQLLTGTVRGWIQAAGTRTGLGSLVTGNAVWPRLRLEAAAGQAVPRAPWPRAIDLASQEVAGQGAGGSPLTPARQGGRVSSHPHCLPWTPTPIR